MLVSAGSARQKRLGTFPSLRDASALTVSVSMQSNCLDHTCSSAVKLVLKRATTLTADLSMSDRGRGESAVEYGLSTNDRDLQLASSPLGIAGFPRTLCQPRCIQLLSHWLRRYDGRRSGCSFGSPKTCFKTDDPSFGLLSM